MNPLLSYKTYGQGEPVMIVHGLFGMLDNWQSIAKVLAEQYFVITIDLRNHGRSFHHETMNFDVMCEDIIQVLHHLELKQTNIIGHSLGGKVAMHLASEHPEFVKKLIVVDVAPYAYPPYHGKVFDALFAVPLDKVQSRGEVETNLRGHLESEGEIQFLMKGLTRQENGQFTWKFNLPLLHKHYLELIQYIPAHAFHGKVLFIKGEQSSYITVDKSEHINDLFPNYEIDVVTNAGHWVHADNPTMFIEIVKNFLQS